MKIIEIPVAEIQETFMVYRVLDLEQINKMAFSISREGQLQPIIVQRSEDGYHLIDGFKRYKAAKRIKVRFLRANVWEVTNSMAKAMILHYNKKTESLSIYEQGLIVYSLHKEHGLPQKEISRLLRQSSTWICRRLSIIERLDVVVQDFIRLGEITVSHVRELIKLPRGNQEEVLRVIIQEHFSVNDSRILINNYLKTPIKDRAFLLENIKEVIMQLKRDNNIYDIRLSIHGNKILKTTEILKQQLNILNSQLRHHLVEYFSKEEKYILSEKFTDLKKQTHNMIENIKNGGYYER
jgi:ParB family transcriptional regulator, chromosome partitioning protein